MKSSGCREEKSRDEETTREKSVDIFGFAVQRSLVSARRGFWLWGCCRAGCEKWRRLEGDKKEELILVASFGVHQWNLASDCGPLNEKYYAHADHGHSVELFMISHWATFSTKIFVAFNRAYPNNILTKPLLKNFLNIWALMGSQPFLKMYSIQII